MSASTRKLWTPWEDSIMRQYYPNEYTADVAKVLKRSLISVYARAGILGLEKSAAFKAMELKKQGDRLRKVGAKHRFPKGHVPPNKGKPMSPEQYKIVKMTMFKKGQIPVNTKWNGHERIDRDGYTLIRIRRGKYVAKHRLLWEKHRGKIPRGMVLVFKDGNKQNIKISNLKLITLKQNMERNTIARYPKELRSVMHLNSKLKRIINEKQDRRSA